LPRTNEAFFRLAFWGALALALLLALLPDKDLGSLGFRVGFSNDKLNHIGAFVVLGVLGSLGWKKHPLLLIGCLLFVGALIEVLQGLPFIGRDRDFLDWVADGGGTIASVIAFLFLQRLYRGHTGG
jgi:hypothetical protein